MKNYSDAMKKSKVIIVGAGAAGIAAATKLVTNAIDDILVLEAENRIGGRVNTVPFGNVSIDLGAQWVHGQKDNVVYEMAEEFDMFTVDQAFFNTSINVNSSKTPVDKKAITLLVNLVEEIMGDEEELQKYDGSLGEFVHSRINFELSKISEFKHLVNSTFLQEFLDFYSKIQNSIDASDTWFDTSAKGAVEYEELEGSKLTVWKSGGYSNVFKLLMKEMSGQTPIDLSKKILLNQEVQSVNWEDPQNISVTCSDGSQYFGDQVLVTVSLGVLKSSPNLFQPSLPSWKKNSIEGLFIGTVDKIFIRFPHKWWPDDMPGVNFLWRKEDEKILFKDIGGIDGRPWVIDAFGFYLTTQDPLTFEGWVTGPSARYMETLSDEQVQIDIMKLFNHFLTPEFTIPEPTTILKTTWGTQKHFKGSYSSRSLTTDKLNASAAQLAAPIENHQGRPVLMFAGEATHDHHYSTVHGAVASGWREAERIIKSITVDSKMR